MTSLVIGQIGNTSLDLTFVKNKIATIRIVLLYLLILHVELPHRRSSLMYRRHVGSLKEL